MGLGAEEGAAGREDQCHGSRGQVIFISSVPETRTQDSESRAQYHTLLVSLDVMSAYSVMLPWHSFFKV